MLPALFEAHWKSLAMRIACLLLIATAISSTGCAAMIAGCGKDLTGLKTKEGVHAQLGTPAKTGFLDGASFEEYHTRQKIAEVRPGRYNSPSYAKWMALTLGTAELIYLPLEICRMGGNTLLGETIRVTYDSTGAVSGIHLDGESLLPLGHQEGGGNQSWLRIDVKGDSVFHVGQTPRHNGAPEASPPPAGQDIKSAPVPTQGNPPTLPD